MGNSPHSLKERTRRWIDQQQEVYAQIAFQTCEKALLGPEITKQILEPLGYSRDSLKRIVESIQKEERGQFERVTGTKRAATYNAFGHTVVYNPAILTEQEALAQTDHRARARQRGASAQKEVKEQEQQPHQAINTNQVRKAENRGNPILAQRYKELRQSIRQQVEKAGIYGRAAEEEIDKRFLRAITGWTI